MFHVENADFIADKLAAELLPNQELREVLKKALEADDRRILADGATEVIVGHRVPLPETVVGGAHRPHVALLRKLEVGGALHDSHFKFVAGCAELLFTLA